MFGSAGFSDPAVTVQQWGNQPSPVGVPPIETWRQTPDDISHNYFIAAPDVDRWIAARGVTGFGWCLAGTHTS